uniref:hypothetical protein n=1 Tax=Streptomyces sp. MSC1_001 TaxID=2909263 RepID=UPI00202F0509
GEAGAFARLSSGEGTSGTHATCPREAGGEGRRGRGVQVATLVGLRSIVSFCVPNRLRHGRPSGATEEGPA